MSNIEYEADGVAFTANVAFATGAGLTDLDGTIVRASAYREIGEGTAVGTATINDDLASVNVIFPAFSMAEGSWVIQVQGFKQGLQPETLLEVTYDILKSAWPDGADFD